MKWKPENEKKTRKACSKTPSNETCPYNMFTLWNVEMNCFHDITCNKHHQFFVHRCNVQFTKESRNCKIWNLEQATHKVTWEKLLKQDYAAARLFYYNVWHLSNSLCLGRVIEKYLYIFLENVDMSSSKLLILNWS